MGIFRYLMIKDKNHIPFPAVLSVDVIVYLQTNDKKNLTPTQNKPVFLCVRQKC